MLRKTARFRQTPLQAPIRRAVSCCQESERAQVSLKESEGRFAQQLMLTLRANMDGLKRRAKVKGKAKASAAAA